MHQNTVPLVEIENFVRRLHQALDEGEEKENDESDLNEQQNITISATTPVVLSGNKKRTLVKDELSVNNSQEPELDNGNDCLFTQTSSTMEDDEYTLEVEHKSKWLMTFESAVRLEAVQELNNFIDLDYFDTFYLSTIFWESFFHAKSSLLS